MNDFSELESELKALRPARPSVDLMARIEVALAEDATATHFMPGGSQFAELAGSPSYLGQLSDVERIAGLNSCPPEAGSATPSGGVLLQRPRQRVNWYGLGLGLAAAAAFLILARMDMDRSPKRTPAVVDTAAESTIHKDEFVPADSTRVVYDTRDEGLEFLEQEETPVRRVRSRARETMQWQNPKTGASLRVSYPSEEVTLTPISGQ